MGIIKSGYTLQFAQRPLRFSAVVPTSVQSKDAHVLCSKMMTLLAKGIIEMIPPAQSESGFCSRSFLIHKKDGGLRPILDLRHLNRTSCVLLLTSFMEMLISFSSRTWYLPTLPKVPKAGSMAMVLLCLTVQQTHLT